MQSYVLPVYELIKKDKVNYLQFDKATQEKRLTKEKFTVHLMTQCARSDSVAWLVSQVLAFADPPCTRLIPTFTGNQLACAFK